MKPVFALFRVAAGPRIGHGHLRRAETIAHALGRPCAISVRGAGARTRLRRVSSTLRDVLDALTPAVVVVDDPVGREATSWCRTWRHRDVPVVSVHDLGYAPVPSTLAVNGSVASVTRRWPADAVLNGLEYAVVRPPRRGPRNARVRRVLVSLGGGPRQALTLAIAERITRRLPDATVVVPQAAGAEGLSAERIEGVSAPDGLAPWFAQVDLAVLAGGVSLYEAIAAGVPSVALAVVGAQRPTVKAFAARQLTVDAGSTRERTLTQTADRTARLVEELAADRGRRQRVWREGPRAVDGRGAARVASAIVAVAGGGPRA